MADEQAAAATANGEDEVDLAPLEGAAGGAVDIRNPNILNLPVQITVAIGKAQLSVQDLLNLTPESIVELDAKIDDPAEIYVGERLIARGELVNSAESDTAIGVRLIQIVDSVAP